MGFLGVHRGQRNFPDERWTNQSDRCDETFSLPRLNNLPSCRSILLYIYACSTDHWFMKMWRRHLYCEDLGLQCLRQPQETDVEACANQTQQTSCVCCHESSVINCRRPRACVIRTWTGLKLSECVLKYSTPCWTNVYKCGDTAINYDQYFSSLDHFKVSPFFTKTSVPKIICQTTSLNPFCLRAFCVPVSNSRSTLWRHFVKFLSSELIHFFWSINSVLVQCVHQFHKTKVLKYRHCLHSWLHGLGYNNKVILTNDIANRFLWKARRDNYNV